MNQRSELSRLFEGVVRRFRNGEHTRQPPVDEGLYPVWSRDSGFIGYVEVVLRNGTVTYCRGDRVSRSAADIHVGWWWSRACPPLPLAPDWN